MQRRKFLIGVGSLAAGSAAAMGTGAFTSVQAQRDFTISVADDASAFLRIEDTEGGNSEFVSTENGVIYIDASETDAGGSGVNKEATTIVRDLFKIENQGTQGVYVWLEGGPDGVGWFADDTPPNALDPTTGISPGSQPSNAPLGHPKSENLWLEPGDKLGEIGFYVTDPSALESDDTDSITLWAATPDEIYFANLGAYADVDQYDSPDDDPNYDGPPS